MSAVPDELSLTCLSLPYGGEVSYIWNRWSQVLMYGDRELEPTDAQWAVMRVVLDTVGVWDWAPSYEDRTVLDGESWSFTAEWDGRKVHAHGQNAAPPMFEVVRGAFARLASVAPARAAGAPDTKRVAPVTFRALEPLSPALAIARRFREGERVTLHSTAGELAPAGILGVKHDVLWTGRIDGVPYAVLEAPPYDLDDLAGTAQLVARIAGEDHLDALDAATVARLEPALRLLAREGRSTDELPFGMVPPVGSGRWLADGLAQYGVVPDLAILGEVVGPGGALALARAERPEPNLIALHLTAPGGATAAFRVDERVEAGGRTFLVVSPHPRALPRRHALVAWPERTVLRDEDRKEAGGALVRALDGSRGNWVHAPGRLTEREADAVWKIARP